MKAAAIKLVLAVYIEYNFYYMHKDNINTQDNIAFAQQRLYNPPGWRVRMMISTSNLASFFKQIFSCNLV